jgi:hypothetical protein
MPFLQMGEREESTGPKSKIKTEASEKNPVGCSGKIFFC